MVLALPAPQAIPLLLAAKPLAAQLAAVVMRPVLTALVVAILQQPLPDLEQLRPDIPVALVDLVYRMLEKDPKAPLRSPCRCTVRPSM